MAEPSRLIEYSRTATRDLDNIWLWNAERYSPSKADAYVEGLRREIQTLAGDPHRGKAVDSRIKVRYLNLHRNPRRHGHVAIYETRPEVVYVLRVLHSAQDWHGMLERGEL